jgi:alcohol dehydrogenase class IV
MYSYDFRAVAHPLRLYSGKDALENLPAELKRQNARRAFIVCGRTVSRKTGLITRTRRILGETCAGVFDGMEKDSTLASLLRARDAARDANADLVIAVGAGSVIQGARIVVILLAETRPIEELVTQYPEHGPAISPRLTAPKLPVINVLTAATTAQNRAGSGAKDERVDHRLEFFDPKTRPVAIFWDTDALLTAPPSMMRATAASVFWRAAMNIGAVGMNPLVEGDRLQALRLARNALLRIADPTDPQPRMDLCAAAFLQNREADDGGTMFARHWVGRVVYAFATALFNLHPEVSQGEANSAFTGTVMRRLGARNLPEMARIAGALEAWDGTRPLEEAPLRAADALDAIFRGIGMPTRVGELGMPQASAPRILDHALKNFNADPKREFVRERDFLRGILLAAW